MCPFDEEFVFLTLFEYHSTTRMIEFRVKNTRKNTSRGKNLVTLRQMVACKAKKKARKICFQTKALDQEKHFFLPFSVYLPLAVKWSDTKNHPA